MSRKPPIRAITFDAYKTLFDFAGSALPTLRTIIPRTDHFGLEAVWETMNGVVVRLLTDFVGRSRTDFERFVTLAEIHYACFAEVKKRHLPALDVRSATEAWNRYIAGVPLFDDAKPAVEWAAARCPTAIVSDIDTWMLMENPALRLLPLSAVVTSEEDGAYKAMTDCTMFQRAAERLDCAVEEILHIGDFPADVVGAKRVGARVLWLNRESDRLPETIPHPDATITSLNELPTLYDPLIP